MGNSAINQSLKFKSQTVLGESNWQIDIDLKFHASREDAKWYGEHVKCAVLLVFNGAPCIEVTDAFGVTRQFIDSEVVITEISESKRKQLGQPLDMSYKENANIALEALINRDPTYMIEESDMVPSSKTLVDFVNVYGAGRSLDIIAYGVNEYLCPQTTDGDA